MSLIHNINYINAEDLDELVGVHWTEFEFSQMAENGSYVYLDLDEDSLEELRESIEWELGKSSLPVTTTEVFHCNNDFLKRLLNQKKLMLMLRDQYGLRDGVLIHIYW
jgi:hypothetical protein